MVPLGLGVIGPGGDDESPDVLLERLVHVDFARDDTAQLDDARQVIEAARDRVLAARQGLIDRANQQLKEYKVDRKRLDDEAEFYAKREMPDKLKRALADNTALQEQQLHQIEDIRAEMQRINEHYDNDLRRYRELLLRGATASPRKIDP